MVALGRSPCALELTIAASLALTTACGARQPAGLNSSTNAAFSAEEFYAATVGSPAYQRSVQTLASLSFPAYYNILTRAVGNGPVVLGDAQVQGLADSLRANEATILALGDVYTDVGTYWRAVGFTPSARVSVTSFNGALARLATGYRDIKTQPSLSLLGACPLQAETAWNFGVACAAFSAAGVCIKNGLAARQAVQTPVAAVNNDPELGLGSSSNALALAASAPMALSISEPGTPQSYTTAYSDASSASLPPAPIVAASSAGSTAVVPAAAVHVAPAATQTGPSFPAGTADFAKAAAFGTVGLIQAGLAAYNGASFCQSGSATRQTN